MNGEPKDGSNPDALFHLQLAEAGYAESQYWMGVCCEHGHGVPKNYADAARWYKKASDQGHVQAYAALDAVNHKMRQPAAGRTAAAPPAPRFGNDAATSAERIDRILDQSFSGLRAMDAVRARFKSILALAAYNGMRRSHQLPAADVSLHTVITGNAGTGKTTLAHVMGRVLAQSGLLASGHVVQVSANELCSSAVVGTEIKGIKKAIADAAGGVLFMDEAHALVNHTAKTNEFWRNIVAELLPVMLPSHTPRMAVIFAGYPQEMERLFLEEPGLKSRFPLHIHLPDYTTDDLAGILSDKAQAQGYVMAEGCAGAAQIALRDAPQRHAAHFGNARYVENFLAEVIRSHAARMLGLKNPSRDDLTRLTPFDITAAAAAMAGK